MPQAKLLGQDDIDRLLETVLGWEQVEDTLVKQFAFKDFEAAVQFVSSLVPVADKLDHHPDVHIHWNTVELVLWTHVTGGITERDFELAQAIDSMR
ncbi:MAG: 4a-hydroxytetrahydrobiopterin dehydratase [Actinomycetota bacterium]|nr:4a-hydroxytetrahydrobiopterin dehydratase [Actinomycetota bacterium]